jgi:transcriptional regulator GlxA family with amidase domain
MRTARQVALVVYQGVQLLDVAGPADVLAAAGRMLGEVAYDVVVASADGKDARCESGLTIRVDRALGDLAGGLDTLIIAGGDTYREAMSDQRLVGEVRRLESTARRAVSICTGAFVLAAAGVLDGRCVTTHWGMCGELASEFPAVRVEPDRIFVREGRVVTSAGVTAGIDLALALVEEDHGVEVARRVARWLVVFVQRPGGQSQFSERLAHPVPEGSPLRSVLDAVVAEPAGDHRLPELARRAAMSERHLGRTFREVTGMTPARYVERVRVEAARDLLERGLPVQAAARLVGLGSAETVRRAFLRVLGVGPADYRARFVPSPIVPSPTGSRQWQAPGCAHTPTPGSPLPAA